MVSWAMAWYMRKALDWGLYCPVEAFVVTGVIDAGIVALLIIGVMVVVR